MDHSLESGLESAVRALAAGHVVAFPTESTYGLGVDALDAAALARLFAIKGREAGKPPPLLVADRAMVDQLAARVPERARALMARFWPGPLTLVLPARAELPEALVLDGGVGLRVSPHAIAAALVTAFGRPVTATSANLAGEPPAVTAEAVRAVFGSAVHVLDGGRAPGAPPSTVVRVSDDGTLTVLRAGAIDPASL
jgi:L-threonylcarbamoyladenylate synthase